MTTRFPAPPDKAPHLRAGEMREVLDLGAIRYDTRPGVRNRIQPNPSGSINVAKGNDKEQR